MFYLGAVLTQSFADAVVEGRFIAEHRRKLAPPAAEDSGPSSAPRPRRAQAAAAAYDDVSDAVVPGSTVRNLSRDDRHQ